MTSMFDDQAMHVGYIIEEVKNRGKQRVEVTAAAEEEWVSQLEEKIFTNYLE
jgi:hypothetical protein